MLNRWHSIKKLNWFWLAALLLAGILPFFIFSFSSYAYDSLPFGYENLESYTDIVKTYSYPNISFCLNNDAFVTEWDEDHVLNTNIDAYDISIGRIQSNGNEYLEIDLPVLLTTFLTNKFTKSYDNFILDLGVLVSSNLTFEPLDTISYGGISIPFSDCFLVCNVNGEEHLLTNGEYSAIDLSNFIYNGLNFHLRIRYLISKSVVGIIPYEGIFHLSANFTIKRCNLYGLYSTGQAISVLSNNIIEGFNTVTTRLISLQTDTNSNLTMLHNDNITLTNFLSLFKTDLLSRLISMQTDINENLTVLHDDNVKNYSDWKNRFASFWMDIKAWFDRQHEDLVKLLEETTHGYDNSSGNSENDKLSGALGGMDEAEGQIMDSASGNLKNYNPSESLNFASGTVAGLSLVKTFANGFFEVSGEFKNIVSVIYAMAFISIVVGLWRFVRK